MANGSDVTVSIELLDGYRFGVDFQMDGVPALVMDEPAPLGTGDGPDAARMLAAAIASCLSASALFCLPVTVEVKPVHSAPATAGTD